MRRLYALYLRYAAVHEDRVRGVALGRFGRRCGQVEQVTRSGDQVQIIGWADVESLHLAWPGGQVAVAPAIQRSDVVARLGVRADTGFEIAAPASARPLTLTIRRQAGPPFSVDIPHPSDPPTQAGQRRLRRAFLRDLLRAAPAIGRYVLKPNDHARTAIKRALRLEVSARGLLLEPAWLTTPPPSPIAAPDVTIILPVFNALSLLQRCLARVEAHTDLAWHLIIVNDASTDPAVRPWLINWMAARRDRVTISEQKVNGGFVAAVNAGFAVAQRRGGDGPVILLNSDAMVPSGWASRLVAPLSDPEVASVTPMSNAAEIFTVPEIGPGLALANGDVDRIDAVARMFGAVDLPETPTGVGFCMALSRDWLKRVPRFDPAFGRGYGEEVDWCQKTRALGARHLCQPRLFVEHVGGQSFGSAEKALRLRAANALIARRYSGYDADVQRFIAVDPLATPRLALAVALASQRAPRLSVFLAHSMGGGAETALMAEVAILEAAIILRVGGPHRWQVEVYVEGQCMIGQCDDLSLIRRLLAPAPALDLIYSCGVGDVDPVTLPDALLSLRRDGCGDQITMRIHDFFPLSPSYTLLEQNGFGGVPTDTCNDPAHKARRPDGSTVSLAQWRAAWGRLVDAAQDVTIFSRSSAELVKAAYPNARTRLCPHQLPIAVRPVNPGQGKCIGLLGNLNRQKGALILRQIAADHPQQAFVVIGHSDSAITLPRNVVLHGAYQPAEISDLAERYGVSRWLFPAIWPETFSFATREALATCLPVAGFALGAQGEALDAAPNGITVPLAPTDTAPARLFAAVQSSSAIEVAAE